MKSGDKRFIELLYEIGDKIEAPHDMIADCAGFSDNPKKEFNICERDDGTIEWYYIERGEKKLLAASKSVTDISYEIFKYITAEMSAKYELNHRTEGKDFRITMFEHQLFLMKRINDVWYKKLNSTLGVLLRALKEQDARVRTRASR